MGNFESRSEKTQSAVPPAVVPSKPSDVYFSSGAFSFAAFMEMLKAQQTQMSDYANLNAALANTQKDNVNAQAAATLSAGEEEKTGLIAQRNQQIVSGVTSGLQIGVSAFGLVKSHQASQHSRNMEGLVGKLNEHPTTPVETVIGDDGAPGDAQEDPTRKDAAEKIADQIKNKTFDYKKLFNQKDAAGKEIDPLDVQLEDNHNLTLKDVLSYAGKKGEENDIRGSIGSAKKLAVKMEISAQNDIQTKMQMGSVLSQAASGFASAPFKQKEATAALAKAVANMQGQYAQSNLQMVQENRQAEAKMADTAASNSQQVWSSISQIVQVDTRG